MKLGKLLGVKKMSEILLVNPRRRRATKKRRTVRRKPAARRAPARRRRRRNPVTRRRRTYRRKRNPNLSARGIQSHLQVATTGAVGAIGLDIALAYVPLPAAIQQGIVGKVVKGLGAIALGVVANKVGVSAANANRMTEGALTVQLHGIGKELLSQFAPGVAMSAYLDDDGLGYYGSGWNPNAIDDAQAMAPGGMGAYLGMQSPTDPNDYGMGTETLGMYEEGDGYGY